MELQTMTKARAPGDQRQRRQPRLGSLTSGEPRLYAAGSEGPADVLLAKDGGKRLKMG